MEYWSISMLSIVIGVLVYYFFRKFNFFERRGIIYMPSVPILGIMAPIIFRQASFINIVQRIYNFNRNAKYIGFYATTKPTLMLRDPELIKATFIKNFDTFINRPSFVDFNEHMLTENLFSLQNTKWRNVRRLLSFFFTSSKMEIIFASISKHAEDFVESISTLPTDKSDMDVRTVFDRYMNDVIALYMCGIKIDSLRNPTNMFYTCGKEITFFSVTRSIKYIFIRSFPKLSRMLNIKLLNNQQMKYFKNVIKNEIAIRDAEHITYLDMIQLMLDNRGKDGQIQLDVDDFIAQAYALYFGGFETSANVISFITYKLATHSTVQSKLRQEIDELLDELNGKVTYKDLNKLKYLDAVIKEALRLFSPVVVERLCDKDYKLPPALPGEKSFTIDKGTVIWAPIHAIHYDEKYYDEPEEFRPERFLNNNQTLFYFPFGLGPKICIGKRFGIMMIKIMLFHLLARCELKPCAKTFSVKFSKKHLLMMSENGFWLNIQRRNDMHSMSD